MQLLKLTVVDFGVGIPSNVRKYLRKRRMPAADAIRWAFQPGATTTPQRGISRGLGLDLLKTFVKTNKGKLEIFSDGAYGLVDGSTEQFVNHEPSFEGTLINITLHSDEAYYYLATEVNDEPWF